MHAQHVYRNARACNKQSHSHFDGPNVERHEDQEGADDDKYDGNHKVELDRPLHVWALVTEVKESRQRDKDEHWLDERGVIDQSVDVPDAQVEKAQGSLKEQIRLYFKQKEISLSMN